MLPDGSTFAPTPEQLVEAGQRADHGLSAAVDALRRRIDHAIDIKTITAIGDTVDEILRSADPGQYDVIVMGTHGRTGLRRLVIGSVAEKVVRRAPIPVLTVREHGAEAHVPKSA
jgi:nucleotide-binding universal stress UspA family protein